MKKNITLSAEESLIERARRKATAEHTTLNQAFREWLQQYSEQEKDKQDYHATMKRLSYARTTKKYSREEMNER